MSHLVSWRAHRIYGRVAWLSLLAKSTCQVYGCSSRGLSSGSAHPRLKQPGLPSGCAISLQGAESMPAHDHGKRSRAAFGTEPLWSIGKGWTGVDYR